MCTIMKQHLLLSNYVCMYNRSTHTHTLARRQTLPTLTARFGHALLERKRLLLLLLLLGRTVALGTTGCHGRLPWRHPTVRPGKLEPQSLRAGRVKPYTLKNTTLCTVTEAVCILWLCYCTLRKTTLSKANFTVVYCMAVVYVAVG